jgi:autotransporter translocation and assembly factor TamB
MLRPDRTLALEVNARAADPGDPDGERLGAARMTGTLDLSTPANPGFDLDLQADRLLAARRRELDLTVSGEMSIAGRYRSPVVAGALRVDGGTLFLDEIYRRYLIVGLEDPLLFEVVDTSLVSVRRVLPPTQNPFLRNLSVENATVSVGQGSWLRSREMNVEVTGDLAIDFNRQAEDLRLTGALEVVRGTYRFDYPPFARIFEVREGVVEFPGTPGIDPNLDITAAYRARTQSEPLEILARLTGTLQAPRVRLSSDAEPPISESDLASYLFFGAPTYAFNVGAVGSASAPADEAGSGGFMGRPVLEAAFNAYGFGYFASGLQTIAQNFGLVDYVGLTAAEAAGPQYGSGLGGLLATTELELGRYLSPRTYVAYTAPLRSPSSSAGFRLEWRFHPTFTAELFAEDRFARTRFGLASSTEPRRKVYGFFLFREWGY